MMSNTRGQWVYYWRKPGTTHEGVRLTTTTMTRENFLKELIRWTNQQPGQWFYDYLIPARFADEAQKLIVEENRDG